jgi:Flp pilus assembly protein TadD
VLAPVVERDPGCREARLSLAKTYIQTNQSEEAIELLRSHAANDAIALSLLGAAYLQKNQLEDACRHLEAALKRDRSLIDARINLAQAYALKGDHAKAARYRLSVSPSPSGPSGRGWREAPGEGSSPAGHAS